MNSKQNKRKTTILRNQEKQKNKAKTTDKNQRNERKQNYQET